jgi:hypothetical protein
MAMSAAPGFAQRIEMYRPSKTALGWCCVLSAIATIAIGFIWGGWVTGGTAATMADSAATGANAKLAASVCAAQFNRAPDADTQRAALIKLDKWDRSTFITKGGWANLPGMTEPVSGAADLCAQQLSPAQL